MKKLYVVEYPIKNSELLRIDCGAGERVLYTEDLNDPFVVLRSLLDEDENIPEGLKEGIWKHFKPGKTYEVIGVAFREKTQEWLVIYKSLYADQKYPKGTLWGRPVDDFLGTKEVDGVEVPRFEYIGLTLDNNQLFCFN